MNVLPPNRFDSIRPRVHLSDAGMMIDDDDRSSSSERETMLRNARRETEQKIAMYGSIDKWPTLELSPVQFKTCTCGCARVNHRLIGTDRAGCRNCKHCRLFTFRGYR